MRRYSHGLGLSAFGAAALLLSGQVGALDISPFVSLGITFGGDTLDETLVGDSTLKNIKSIKAGQFMYVAAGATVPLAQAGVWEAQSSLGYWFDSVQSAGHELRFRRVPIDLLLVRNFDN